LYHYFIEQGFSPTSTSKGPDFGIDFENKTIWIEAISPEPRNIPIDFLEPPEDEFEVQSLPEEEILLRITSSVKEKAKKFKEYLKKGVISKDDICVIAIDITQLGFWSHLTTNNFPPFLNAVYPIGHIQITINKKNKKVIKSDYEYRDSIQNKNQSDVPTNTFLNDYFLPIGAILGARTNNLITLNNITVIHNFLARSRFPSNFFRVEHEYYPEQKEDKIILSDLAENN
jgi:type I restriction enzyme S subunit